MMENARKQIFHVMTLLTLTVVCASTLLSYFTLGAQDKILKDLCMSSILFCGGLLAVALAATAIPGEVESKTCYPVLARPIRRSELVIGKFLGTISTVYLGLAVIAAAFITLLAVNHSLDIFLIVALGFTLLQVAVIAAVTMCLSTFATPAVTSMVSLLVYIAGTIKIGYFKPMIDSLSSPFERFPALSMYHLLPNLESFNFKDALVHHLHVPSAYMLQVAIYGLFYIAIALTIASGVFARKEL